jgi:hypothetical protein
LNQVRKVKVEEGGRVEEVDSGLDEKKKFVF